MITAPAAVPIGFPRLRKAATMPFWVSGTRSGMTATRAEKHRLKVSWNRITPPIRASGVLAFMIAR